MEWKNSDPRFDIYKRAKIVIVRPLFGAGTGEVETKHAWAIWTSYEDHKFLNADDTWDQDWWWIYAPS